jgi:uncharacterized protein
MSTLYANPNTPGVKITEASLLPPSIVQVSSAIPVFLGYTHQGTLFEPLRITSFKEFTDHFGGPKEHTFTLDASFQVTLPSPTTLDYFFYECIQLYFTNGGGACYILPIGLHGNGITFNANHLEDCLAVIEKLDEPTIIAFPEAVAFDQASYGTFVQSALDLCQEMKDRFVLIDTPKGTTLTGATNDLSSYRGILSGNLSYGAAYYPHLEVNLRYSVNELDTKLDGTSLHDLKANGSQDYLRALNALTPYLKMTLPPSALIAGVYAKTDREKGVWKAPANVALQGVVKPLVAISDSTQEALNVDAGTGKSINAIRSFAGQGTLIWGARTLAGNSNEWRYVPVRRLFITVEESVKKAIAQFVFENNDAKTWVKVSSMINSYLNGMWKDGALLGAKAEDAYFVNVGLGTTMTTQDVLEGKMIVRIGLAAVRPAEFIVLEFSHFINQ